MVMQPSIFAQVLRSLEQRRSVFQNACQCAGMTIAAKEMSSYPESLGLEVVCLYARFGEKVKKEMAKWQAGGR
jgi:hypothetical protein